MKKVFEENYALIDGKVNNCILPEVLTEQLLEVQNQISDKIWLIYDGNTPPFLNLAAAILTNIEVLGIVDNCLRVCYSTEILSTNKTSWQVLSPQGSEQRFLVHITTDNSKNEISHFFFAPKEPSK